MLLCWDWPKLLLWLACTVSARDTSSDLQHSAVADARCSTSPKHPVGSVMLQTQSSQLDLSVSAVNTSAEPVARRVYIDLGANWANTLRLYKDIDKESKGNAGPWEVYAFEASPLIQPYLQNFGEWLNGNGPRPRLMVPPAGSTVHLRQYAAHYGCNEKTDQAMRECMFRIFHKPLSKLEKSVATKAFIEKQLQLASKPIGANDKDRYVIVPAAVGETDGTLTLSEVTAEQMIRGGAHSSGHSSKETTVDVPQVDFAAWLSHSFKEEDHIVVKMDIEGAEFPILQKLEATNKLGLLDVLAIECHVVAGDCKGLMQKLQAQKGLQLLTEGQGYHGWDSLSSPKDYLPEQPEV